MWSIDQDNCIYMLVCRHQLKMHQLKRFYFFPWSIVEKCILSEIQTAIDLREQNSRKLISALFLINFFRFFSTLRNWDNKSLGSFFKMILEYNFAREKRNIDLSMILIYCNVSLNLQLASSGIIYVKL